MDAEIFVSRHLHLDTPLTAKPLSWCYQVKENWFTVKNWIAKATNTRRLSLNTVQSSRYDTNKDFLYIFVCPLYIVQQGNVKYATSKTRFQITVYNLVKVQAWLYMYLNMLPMCLMSLHWTLNITLLPKWQLFLALAESSSHWLQMWGPLGPIVAPFRSRPKVNINDFLDLIDFFLIKKN